MEEAFELAARGMSPANTRKVRWGKSKGKNRCLNHADYCKHEAITRKGGLHGSLAKVVRPALCGFGFGHRSDLRRDQGNRRGGVVERPADVDVRHVDMPVL